MALSISRLIQVAVNLSPLTAQGANLDTLLIIGSSGIIDANERLRIYNDIDAVTADFGSNAPEAMAAALYFNQTPQPQTLAIAAWAKTATHGRLAGALLSSAAQTLSHWTTISGGAFKIDVDGTHVSVGSLDFSTVTNLNGVAAVINTGLTAACTGAGVAVASVAWTGSRFMVNGGSSGPTSTVGYAYAPASQTDISSLLGLTSGLAIPPVAGIAAEAVVDVINVCLDRFPNNFFGFTFADADVSDANHLAIAALAEQDGQHLYGLTTQNVAVLDGNRSDDLFSLLKAAGYSRTVTQYSSTSPYAIVSLFGRAFTVDFDQPDSALTLMFKQEPGIIPETLSNTQASAVAAKNGNVFVSYNNGSAILQQGKVAGGAYFDEIHGLSWLASTLQSEVYDLLYTSASKIAQTDSGNNILHARIESVLARAQNNGLLGSGTWDQAGFGTLKQGDLLPKGYYVYVPPISTQSPADRAARRSVPFRIAAKLAGAIHDVAISINVNR